jgi:gluconate 5-dehydrogenase
VDRWATFDCYGTLVDWLGGQRAEFARVFGADRVDELVERYHELEPELEAEQPGLSYRAVMAEAMKQLGRIDVLVNSTGGNDIPKLLHQTAVEEIPGILERCLFAQILCSRAALPYMRDAKKGAIINIASDAAKIPTPGESVIGAAMAGIVMFTRGVAVEGKRDGIRANVLTPSMTSGTEHFEKVMADPFAGRMFAKAGKMAALGVVSKEELAGLVVFLASPAASKITGQAISMTGGISAL